MVAVVLSAAVVTEVVVVESVLVVLIVIMAVARAAVTYSGTVGPLLRDHPHPHHKPSGPETTLL